MSLFQHRFANWSKTVHFKVDQFLEPESEADILTVVREARRDRKVVRAQGAGHSFSQIITTSDVLLSLDRLTGIESHQDSEVTVHAGTRLKDLIPALKARGLALRNIGSVTEQSIAGAVSTGTHGTGRRLGSMSSQVKALRLVRGDGTTEDIDSSNPTALSAARVSLGTLGVMTRVTLDCVEYYDVDYDAYVCDFDRAVTDLVTLTRENERVLLWWFLLPLLPRTKVVIITKNRAPSPPRGILAGAHDLEDDLWRPRRWFRPFRRRYQGALPRYGTELAASLRALRSREDEYTRILHRRGGYEDMLTIPLLPVYHRECEYAIPVERAPEALRAMQSVFEETDAQLLLPVEVRFVARDSEMLSPASNGDVCYIGASTLLNATEIFDRFEPLMKERDGRPHWGKHSHLTRAEVSSMYPRHSDFVRERRERDPDGVFLNTLLRRLFA